IRTLAAVREIDEVSIGHAILARAVFVGLPKAVEDMARLVNSGGK
ncbi:MAG: pyridoxine 5'-phosphate synthase, partial [Ignavibacteria bacterium]|nr:pyridoxine 5'-phosphate synthase [Ignavibacteria bacterium]